MLDPQGKVCALEEIWSLGTYLKECDQWGQFLTMYRNMGSDCVYTRTSARLLFDEPEFRKRMLVLRDLLTDCLEG